MLKKIYTSLLIVFLSMGALAGCASHLSSEGKENLKQGKENFVAGNYPLAFKQLSLPAEQGDAAAQYAVGYMYYYGKGVTKNLTLGRQWIERSAQQGNKMAIRALKLIQQKSSTL